MSDSYFKNSFCEKVYSAYHYYSISEKLSNTFRITLSLIDDIDGTILKKAIELAYERHPYLRVKRVQKDGAICLKYNEKPIIVKNSQEPVTLGDSEMNEHLFGFTYYDNSIYFNGFHGLVDGRGAYFFLKTLLYYYCSAKYKVTLPTEGIRIVGDEIKKEEYLDPFPRSYPSDLISFSKRRFFLNSFHLRDDHRLTRSGKYCSIISIDEKEFMRHCRVNDGSPIALVAVVVCRAIRKLNPNNKKPINAGIAMDLRGAFNAPEAHHSLTDILSIEFSEEIAKSSFTRQNTAFRGQILLKSDPDTVCSNMQLISKIFNIMDRVPSIAIKKALFGTLVPQQFSANTFLLSYVGKTPFGAMQKYIINQINDMDAPEIGISAEVANINGKFIMSFVFDFKEDLYLKAICDEFAEQGLEYTCTPLKQFSMPKCKV